MPKKVDLNTIEKRMRKDMIYQMKNFLYKYRLNQICLYYSIYIMDKLLAKRIKLNVNEVAVTSLLITIKFLDIDGHIPPIKHFLELLRRAKDENVGVEILFGAYSEKGHAFGEWSVNRNKATDWYLNDYATRSQVYIW